MDKRTLYFEEKSGNSLFEGLKILLDGYADEKRSFECVTSGASKSGCFHLTERQWDAEELKVTKSGDQCEILYQQKAHFFRGVTLFLQNIEKRDFVITEKVNFRSNGMMMDCSRNCVPTTDTIKKYIVRLAKFGMNRLYMYMEDTLEIEDYPYWGYLRGRYSKEEIRDCDRFAVLFGVTLVPCIQTLAHLRTVLNLPAFREYKDIDDILLLEDEKPKALLGSLLEAISECFSGGIVHLGMDEADHLGRGRYMNLHGWQDPARLMKKHLNWLVSECEKYNLKPMIWSDMYMRLNFHSGNYYGISENEQPADQSNLSQDVTLCYWDYYSEGKEAYLKNIRLHQKLGNPLVFAGGAWTWNGIAPNVSKAVKTSCDALDACIEKGVQDVFFTAWMDNGAETPLQTCLPVLALFGEYGFGDRPDFDWLSERFCHCLGKKFRNYLLLDAFDNRLYQDYRIGDPLNASKHNVHSENPSKTILYQDCMMGIYEKMFDEQELQDQYIQISEELNERLFWQEDLDVEDRTLLSYYELLADVLSIKSMIGERIRSAYAARDMEELSCIEDDLEMMAALVDRLGEEREHIWMNEYKPFGYEVVDIRLVGVARRAKSAIHRIDGLLSGRQEKLLELEEEILPYKTREILDSEDQQGSYFWEQIVTRGNVVGI